jgi:hypothetical protein
MKLRELALRHPPILPTPNIRDSVFIITLLQINGSRSSVVDIVTRLLAGWSSVRISAGAKEKPTPR